MCEPTIVKHIRELEPTTDGWRQYEDTGQSCTSCTCGTTTGFVPTREASAVYREHANS